MMSFAGAVVPGGDRQPATGQAAGGWADYWEGLGESSWLYREQSELYVENLVRQVPLEPDTRVLDFGCGFGMVAEALAPRVGEVWFWDAAANMRRRAMVRVQGLANARLFEPIGWERRPDRPPFDVILVNSVIQYMTTDEFVGWVGVWREWLASGGQVVVSDVIVPGNSAWRDLLDLFRFAHRRGVLGRAIRQVIAGLRGYGTRRRAVPLTAYSPEQLGVVTRAAGLDIQFLPENLTHFRRRITACFSAAVAERRGGG